MEDWELSAHIGISTAVNSYVHFADGGRFDRLVELFAPDGELVVGDARHVGHAAIRAMFERARQHLAGSPGSRIQHHLSSLLVHVEGPTRATTQCYWAALMAGGVDHWGRYRDSFVHQDGRWLIERRRISQDGCVPGGWGSRGQEWVADPDAGGSA